jgi:hypothetical protein
MTFEEWVQYGVDKNWSTEIYCDTHDAPRITVEEGNEFDEGGDPCLPVIRIWNW